MVNYVYHKPDREKLLHLLTCEHDSPAGLILRFAWQLGLMRGEIQTLRWSQIDPDDALIRLPGRSVPIPPEMLPDLAQLKSERIIASDFVVANSKGRPFAEQYISRLARQALDLAEQQEVRLIDLRHDYVVRQLQEHDWQYVSQVTGIGQVSLRYHFMTYVKPAAIRQKPAGLEPPPEIDPEKITRLMKAELYSPAGTLIRLSYRMGLLVSEMRHLTWRQVDLSQAVVLLPERNVSIPADVLAYLTELKNRNGKRSDYVIISKRAGKPLEAAYISKTARAALVSAGIRDVTLSDLCSQFVHRTQVEEPVLKLVKERGSVMRSSVISLLNISGTQAYSRLSRMVAAGKLVRVGNRYFLPEQTTPPDLHAKLILDYLRREGSAVRQDFARLLNILPRQVYPILQKLISSGRIVFEDGRYYPADLK